MTDEDLKLKLIKFNQLSTIIESFTKEKDMIEVEVLELFKDRNIKNIELDEFDVTTRAQCSYKYSDRVTEMETKMLELTSSIKQGIKELKDYEKSSGVAEKIEGNPKLKIKQK